MGKGKELHEAEYYEKREENEVRCHLCPRRCIIKPGELGECQARKNMGGVLYTLSYNYFTSAHADPIEKKPLYHYKPGSRSMSFGSAGCNLHCDFCQNWSISQMTADSSRLYKITSQDAIAFTERHVCETIAYTYNEPLINFEWIKETGQLAHKNGINNVLVSNGLINKEPLEELLTIIDAANIDIKAFTTNFYKDICHFPGLERIKQNAKTMFDNGVHVELTMLVIPGYNDNPEEIEAFVRWVRDEMSEKVPVHFSRFYPHYKMQHVSPTPVQTILKAKDIALDNGLKYVFVGNLPSNEENHTFCQNCNAILVKRIFYSIKLVNLKEDGTCAKCGTKSDIIV
ncbi:MAG: AmmeMemoRadiSam system radical SAM enzyme [Candidatus Heimdallarchaeaceae archaeon]